MRPILEIAGLSKKYRIRHQSAGYLTLREQLGQWLRFNHSTSEEFWALDDITFDVNPGESIGIIGRNGAGKSTLLKILSKITPPTKGRVITRGRIASLLEVGTGFHPELTGRENIYFNGSLLGMQRREISGHFDEIVDFSGTERFLDTQLKHYSSGMQLRLAFSVAAFLQPEILILDEVLAVGDAEFQKKCLGKMEDVSRNEGRTILFVSHQMSAVKKLCRRAIILDNGKLIASGDVEQITEAYARTGLSSANEKIWPTRTSGKIDILRAAAYAKGQSVQAPISTSDEVVLEIDFINNLGGHDIDVTFDIHDTSGVHITHFGMICDPDGRLSTGKFRTTGIIPGNLLNTNQYIVSVQFGLNQSEVVRRETDMLRFDVIDNIRTRGKNFSRYPGVIHPICDWQTTPLS